MLPQHIFNARLDHSHTMQPTKILPRHILRVVPRVATALGFIICLMFSLTSHITHAQSAFPDEQKCLSNPPVSGLEQGWCLAMRRDKGNCIACHTMNIAPWPDRVALAGNIAPPLVAMRARFPDAIQLQQIISDAAQFNANSFMPPYGKHRILKQEEIKLIAMFLHTL